MLSLFVAVLASAGAEAQGAKTLGVSPYLHDVDALVTYCTLIPRAPPKAMSRKLILRNFQSPGDIVMLTAAVRDLHRCHPGRFLTDVRTSCPDVWLNNPWLTCIADDDPEAETVDCQYPLIHRSNSTPCHALEGFADFLSDRLGVPIQTTEFRGDIHICNEEKGWFSNVEGVFGRCTPFWLLVSGGKLDYTIKWWDSARYQEVIDHFRGRIEFVQVGEAEHHHPPLRGVVDLRGQTDLRALIRLTYFAQGVLSPVSLLMHLAAAVETPPDAPKSRPCVVVAGGREPPHYEAYPHHQFIHTVGALPCCEQGGCWRSRTLPIGDGDEKDRSDALCLDVVGQLPRCMHLIGADEVIRRIEIYFDGGVLRYLHPPEASAHQRADRRARAERPEKGLAYDEREKKRFADLGGPAL